MPNLKFNLKEKRDIFIVNITADYNDADYSSKQTILSQKDFLEKGYYEIMILKRLYSHSHGFEEYSKEKIDLDRVLRIPYGEIGVCHTLESITIEYIDQGGITYDVKLEALEDEPVEVLLKYLKYVKIFESDIDDEDFDDEDYVTNRLEEEELRMSIYNS